MKTTFKKSSHGRLGTLNAGAFKPASRFAFMSCPKPDLSKFVIVSEKLIEDGKVCELIIIPRGKYCDPMRTYRRIGRGRREWWQVLRRVSARPTAAGDRHEPAKEDEGWH